jgi:hypothetical protein
MRLHPERPVKTPALLPPRPRRSCRHLPSLLLLAGAIGLASAAPAGAQVDVNLLRESWESVDHWADTGDKPLRIATGRLDGTTDSVRIFHWDSYGRVKFDRDDSTPGVWLEYRLLAVSVRSDLPAIDHTFYDIVLAGAGRVESLGDGWTLSATAGMGTANDGSFRNTDALYATAAVVASQAPGAPARWHLGLSYNGNGALLPAAPVPVIECELTPDPAIRLQLGIPRTELVARPADGLAATLRWDYPTNALARLEQDLGLGWSLFAEGSRRVDGFHMRESESTRMFYELNAAEAGVRWVTSWADVSLSAGYAFEQSFFTGYDLRNRDEVGSPVYRPFVALSVQGTY